MTRSIYDIYTSEELAQMTMMCDHRTEREEALANIVQLQIDKISELEARLLELGGIDGEHPRRKSQGRH